MHDAAVEPISSHPTQLQPSAMLRQILKDNEEFFHGGQQTNKMLRENNRRSRLSHENHQKSLLPLLLEHGYSWSLTELQSKYLNPLDVTLTLQIFKDEAIPLYRRRSPDNLAAIMRETNTMVRFPDRDDEGVLSCQVAISGTLADVENARARVRALTTISISLPVEIEGPLELQRWIEDHQKSLPAELFYETIGPQQKQMFEKPTIRVSGTLSQENELAAAMQQLRAAFYNRVTDPCEVLFVAELTVPITQMEMYLGGERAEQLVAIARDADVYLHFIPIQGDRPHFAEFQNFIITGSEAAGVIHALKIMTSLQPVQLSFNVLGDDLVDKIGRDTTQKVYDEELKVHNYVSPSMKQIHLLPEDPIIHFVCMTAQEHNIGNIYKYLKGFLREEVLAGDCVPDSPIPSHMDVVLSFLQLSGRQLDIQNYEFPQLTMEGLNEKGDIMLIERSMESEETENPFVAAPSLEVPNGDGMRGGMVNPFLALQQDSLSPYFNNDFNEQYHREMPHRGHRDFYFDNAVVDNRGFPRNYRGRGRGGFYSGDRRGPPRRFRDFGGKNDFPRTRNPPFHDDRSATNDRRFRNTRDGEESRPYNNRFRELTRNRLDDASLDGYMAYYMGPYGHDYMGSVETGNAANAKPQRSVQDSWKPRDNWKPAHNDSWKTSHDNSRGHDSDQFKGRTQNKVLLANKKHYNDSHNCIHEEEADMPKRISPRDLIDKANEEINTTGSANTSGQSDHSRITYARMVGGSTRKDGIPEKGTARSEGPANERYGRRRSYSTSDHNNKFNNYNHDSPFARNARQLDCRVDVEHVLFSINCDKYADQFRNSRIVNLQDFARLNESDLLRIGVKHSLDRATILEYIQKMRQSFGHSSNHATAQSRSGPSAL